MNFATVTMKRCSKRRDQTLQTLVRFASEQNCEEQRRIFHAFDGMLDGALQVEPVTCRKFERRRAKTEAHTPFEAVQHHLAGNPMRRNLAPGRQDETNRFKFVGLHDRCGSRRLEAGAERPKVHNFAWTGMMDRQFDLL